MIRRPPRSTLDRSSAASDVYKRQLYILRQLQERHVPFLVIEPAKTEYRGLIRQPGFENLLVFTLGDETTAPFRLNPFELLPGVRLEVHLEALNVAINAAMPQFGVLPSIIAVSYTHLTLPTSDLV